MAGVRYHIPMPSNFCSILLLGTALLQSALAAEYFVYTGTYTRAGSKGIYAFRFDSATGRMGPAELAAETPNPAFLAAHPNGRFLYAVNEQDGGTVTAFAIDKTSGALTKLNTAPSGGSAPCHLAVDRTGKALLVANFNGGSVAVLPIESDGRLGQTPFAIRHTGSSIGFKQESPHPHQIVFSADNRFVFVPDYGIDQVMAYRLDPSKPSIAPNDPPFVKLPPGSAPRHFAFHPSGKFAYVNNELGSSVTVFAYDAPRGALKEMQTVSTLPLGFSGHNDTAEAEVDARGRFLYVSNRGHDSIAVFAIGANGTLTPVEHASTAGKAPRHFKIDPTGAYLFAANQDSGNVVQFRIDPKSGRLTATGRTVEVVLPVCLLFAAAVVQ